MCFGKKCNEREKGTNDNGLQLPLTSSFLPGPGFVHYEGLLHTSSGLKISGKIKEPFAA